MSDFVVGIDLGTTNTVVASSPADDVAVEVVQLTQLVGPGEPSALDHLPSCLYLPAAEEFADDATRLPWGDAPAHFLGHFAAQHGAKVPGRSVVSAKSWLSFAGVDRSAPILPWGGADDVDKLSPVEASTWLLAHLRAAWDHAHPDHPLVAQDVVLTVPASFDEVARGLTAQAARDAGLAQVRLLEEPQAAFYDFLLRQEQALLAALAEHRLILVVDVGGGTTDLTLVEVRRQESKPPALERVAVGDHLMLGGDNMDALLGRHVEQELTGTLGGLDAARWGALTQSARLAKEVLLGAAPPAEMRVLLPGRGARLIGGGKSSLIQREHALTLLLDGFFPLSAPDQGPLRRSRVALAEFGLPYADDPAVPHHICGFLRRHAATAAAAGARMYDGLPRPDAVLLNGGVFNSVAIRERLQAVLAGWFDGDAVPLLDVGSLDLAVARGAAYYGLVRRGHGVRIGGGSARSYFVGVEDEQGQQQALCVVPRGMLEGSEHEVDRTFWLRLDQPIAFPLFTSTGERHTRHGALGAVEDELGAMPPLRTVLRPRPEVPVKLRAALTEVGTLEISLHATPEALQQWQLSFSTRDEVETAAAPSAGSAAVHQKLDEARELIERYYGSKQKDVSIGAIKNLRRHLEKLLGPWEQWSIGLSRELFGAVLTGAKHRRRSADHERVLCMLAGYCARPGFGAPFDDWRSGELWKLYPAGVQYTKDKTNWAAWWILWRRIAGGLDAAQQQILFADVWPWLDPSTGRPKGARPHGEDEMVRLLATLERVAADDKVVFGRWLLRRLRKGAIRSWWPLGRLGARQPFAGSVHDVVPHTVVEEWLEVVLSMDWNATEGAALAAVQLARRVGDRERDLSEPLRTKVLRALRAHKVDTDWIRMVDEVVELSDASEAEVIGDSLPIGLKLR